LMKKLAVAARRGERSPFTCFCVNWLLSPTHPLLFSLALYPHPAVFSAHLYFSTFFHPCASRDRDLLLWLLHMPLPRWHPIAP
jgi:hypothetical protein